MDTIIKDVKNVELKTRIVNVILNMQTLKMIFQYTSVHAVTRITQKSLMKT